MTKITQAEFARRHNKSKQYINKLVNDGEIKIIDGLVDTKQADPIMTAKRLKRKAKTRDDDNDINKLQLELLKSQIQNSKYKGKLLANQLKKDKDQYVLASDVEKEGFETARVVRDNILNVPDRVSQQLLGLNDAGIVHKIISDELRLALDTIADCD